MNLNQLFQEHSADIIAEAQAAIERARLAHYEKSGSEHTHQRLKALYTLTTKAVKEKNLGPMIAHADTVARERFEAGFDLSEVQTAFNVLEEAMWMHVLKNLPPAELGEALGLISTVLGAGKDKLARTYVSLASKSKAPSLNMQSLFGGTEGS
jgi:hypothetical protein